MILVVTYEKIDNALRFTLSYENNLQEKEVMADERL